MDLKVTKLTETKREGYYETYRGSRGRTMSRRLPDKDTPAGKSRVYVHVEGEGLWDDFANRTSRPYTLWRQPIIDAMKKHGFGDVKLRWSQKAGCSCPCSPAFFVTGHDGSDFWATIEANEPQRTNKLAAAVRLAQVDIDPSLPDVLGGKGRDLLEALRA